MLSLVSKDCWDYANGIHPDYVQRIFVDIFKVCYEMIGGRKYLDPKLVNSKEYAQSRRLPKHLRSVLMKELFLVGGAWFGLACMRLGHQGIR
jgi:hypothetical protein